MRNILIALASARRRPKTNKGTSRDRIYVMSPDELAYYRERALFERRRASDSTTKHAANIHLELACLYERIIDLEEQHAPTLRIVEIGHPDVPIGEGWSPLAGGGSDVPLGGRTSPKHD